MDTNQQVESALRSPVVAAVDDNPMVLRTLGQVLTRSGYQTLLFDDPRTALSGIQSAAVDLVITDRDMPQCSGPELAQQLRRGWNGHGPPLVLLSGNVSELAPHDRALFDLVLAKPIAPRELLAAIRGLRSAPR